MAAADTTVKKIEIRASTTGIDQARSQASNLEQTLNAVAAANEKLAAAFSQASAANDNFIQAQEKANKTWTQSARDLLTWLDIWERLKSSVKSSEETFHSVASAVAATNFALRAMGVAFTPLIVLSRTLFALGAGIEILQRAASDFEKMVSTGERAEKLDIAASFIQGFDKISTAARISESAMAKALDSAATFVRDTFGETNKLVQLLSDIEDKIGGTRLAASKALELPTNTEDRLRIAADAMRELESRGERLAALKIAESMGLGELAEKLRAGQMSMAELANAVGRISSEGGLDTAAQRALELQRAIEQTKQEISEVLSTSINLSSVHESILNVWLQILQAVKTVIGWLNTGLETLNNWGNSIDSFLRKFENSNILRAMRLALQLGNTTLGLNDSDRPLVVGTPGKPGIGQRTIANPVVPPVQKIKEAGRAAKEATDEFDQMVKRIEDSTRKLEEQAVTFGMGAGAAARYRAEVELMTAAQRANRDVTPELAARIKYLADKAGEAADKLEKMRQQHELINDLVGAGTSGFTSFVKDLGSGTKAADALTKALGGVADALINVGKKSLDKSLTTGIEGLLKGGGLGGFGFDPVSLGIGAAGMGVSMLLGQVEQSNTKSKQRKQQIMDTWAKAQQDEFDAIQAQQQAVIDAGIAAAKAAEKAAEDATRKAEDAARRIESFQDRAFLAGIDASATSGQLAIFDLQAQRQREAEIRAGGEAIVALEEALYEERERIVRDGVDALLAEEQRRFDEAQQFLVGFAKSIRQFLDNLTAGPGSTLSPQDRLTAAQNQFNTQYTLGQSGNRDALSGITTYANNLLEASQAFYGSTAGYQNTYNDVTSRLSALPAIVSPEQLIVNAIDGQTTSLSQLLNELDTNGDGMISRQEAANSWLSQVFNELDTNGDGQISRLELIKSATQGTEGNVDTTIGQNSTSNTYLDAVAINTQQLATIQQQLQTIFNTTAKTSNNAARTANNTMYSANADTQSSAGIAGDFTYARGGWVYGAGGGTSDSIRAMLSNGEYVVRAQAASALRPYMDTINQGRLPTNDNDAAMGALLAEVRTLRAEITTLRTENTRAIAAAAEYDREGMEQISDTMNQLVRETKRANAA